MRALRFLPACLAACLLGGASLASQPAPNAWPAPQREHKPWTRWWWPASAVDKANLTRQLEQIAAANLGGVEITPIYGAKGFEDRYIDFLSPGWMEMLEHVAREAKRLGLGVDMSTGTGWPFGGPGVAPEDSNTKTHPPRREARRRTNEDDGQTRRARRRRAGARSLFARRP